MMDPQLKSRASAVFSCIMRTTTELLLWEHSDSLPSDLKPDDSKDTYITMLFNDEIHTYEQVAYVEGRCPVCGCTAANSYSTSCMLVSQ